MNNNSKQLIQKYKKAEKRVRQKKIFFEHAMVYLAINAIIFLIAYILELKVINVEDYWARVMWQIGYVDALLWGVGLLVHGAVIFLPDFIFGKNWERRKINELMNDKNK